MKKSIPVIDFSAFFDSCLVFRTDVQSNPQSKLIDTKANLAKSLNIKGNIEDNLIVEAILSEVTKIHKNKTLPSFFPDKPYICCSFQFGLKTKVVSSESSLLDTCIHVGYLQDSLNSENVLYSPNHFRPSNVSNFICKSSLEEWKKGSVYSNLFRVKNQFISNPIMTREIPEDWGIEENLDV